MRDEDDEEMRRSLPSLHISTSSLSEISKLSGANIALDTIPEKKTILRWAKKQQWIPHKTQTMKEIQSKQKEPQNFKTIEKKNCKIVKYWNRYHRWRWPRKQNNWNGEKNIIFNLDFQFGIWHKSIFIKQFPCLRLWWGVWHIISYHIHPFPIDDAMLMKRSTLNYNTELSQAPSSSLWTAC